MWNVLAHLWPAWGEPSPEGRHEAQFDLCLACAWTRWGTDLGSASPADLLWNGCPADPPVCLSACWIEQKGAAGRVCVRLQRAETAALSHPRAQNGVTEVGLLISPTSTPPTPPHTPRVDFKASFHSTSGFSINAAGIKLALMPVFLSLSAK